MSKYQRQLFIVLSLLMIFISNNLFSQRKYEKNFYGGIFYLSEFISSKEFEEIKLTSDDYSAVDSIYYRAVNFFNGDISEALLCLTFACLPFKEIEIKFLFNKKIIVPLPSPPLSLFPAKLKNLPAKIFFDSPVNEFGDKDKLSHFFGNAFLKYNSCFFNLSKFLGIFVEVVERDLFINGSFDYRDIITNHLGELFGELIKHNKNILPSHVLKIYQLLFIRF